MLLKSLLSQLLGMIDNLNIMAHMFLISLGRPANVNQMFSTLFPLITLDFLQIGMLNELIFKFSELRNFALSDIFNEIGYS